jgi:hypothetical protein
MKRGYALEIGNDSKPKIFDFAVVEKNRNLFRLYLGEIVNESIARRERDVK